jgi:hypothetical protein
MKNSRPLQALWLTIGALSFVATAHAQEPMGQGEAMINVRSDVKMGIKGTRGTSNANLQELTDVVAGKMPDFRRCYAELVAKRPSTVGALAIRITLDPGAKPKLELKEQGGEAPELTKCVEKVLQKAPLAKVARPAAAIVTLDFQNTRAEGQREMQAAQSQAEAVAVREEGDQLVGTFRSLDGKVTLEVRGKVSDRGRTAVEAVTAGLRDRYPLFADCRRRAEKGGLSPAGVVAVEVRVQGGGKNSSKVRSSTVAHERAVPCVERAMRKIKFDGAPPGQKLDLTITFSG